jgi:hypothetical protein
LDGVKSAPNRSVIIVIVVSAHCPTVDGRIEEGWTDSSTNTGSGGGCHLSGEALPIDRSEIP